MIEPTQLRSRLRTERKRLRLSQEALAEMAGVSRTAQAHYELGKTPPDVNYIARLSGTGVDVTYILSGRRSGEVAAELLDWDLHNAIVRSIRDLMAEQHLDLPLAKQLAMVRLLYRQFAPQGRVDLTAVRRLADLAT